MGKGPSTTPKIDDGVWLANLFNFKNFQNLDHDRESGTSLGVTHKIAHRREADLCTVPPPLAVESNTTSPGLSPPRTRKASSEYDTDPTPAPGESPKGRRGKKPRAPRSVGVWSLDTGAAPDDGWEEVWNGDICGKKLEFTAGFRFSIGLDGGFIKHWCDSRGGGSRVGG